MTTLATNQSDTVFSTQTRPAGRLLNGVTWTLQVLLGLLFVFAGAMKFVTPMEQMTQTLPMPAAFLYFIGASELLGGFGMILPGALKIRRGLTPLAAIGLSIIMCGAVVVSAKIAPASVGVPLLVGLLSSFVAYRRWPWLAR